MGSNKLKKESHLSVNPIIGIKEKVHKRTCNKNQYTKNINKSHNSETDEAHNKSSIFFMFYQSTIISSPSFAKCIIVFSAMRPMVILTLLPLTPHHNG